LLFTFLHKLATPLRFQLRRGKLATLFRIELLWKEEHKKKSLYDSLPIRVSQKDFEKHIEANFEPGMLWPN